MRMSLILIMLPPSNEYLTGALGVYLKMSTRIVMSTAFSWALVGAARTYLNPLFFVRNL